LFDAHQRPVYVMFTAESLPVAHHLWCSALLWRPAVAGFLGISIVRQATDLMRDSFAWRSWNFSTLRARPLHQSLLL